MVFTIHNNQLCLNIINPSLSPFVCPALSLPFPFLSSFLPFFLSFLLSVQVRDVQLDLHEATAKRDSLSNELAALKQKFAEEQLLRQMTKGDASAMEGQRFKLAQMESELAELKDDCDRHQQTARTAQNKLLALEQRNKSLEDMASIAASARKELEDKASAGALIHKDASKAAAEFDSQLAAKQADLDKVCAVCPRLCLPSTL